MSIHDPKSESAWNYCKHWVAWHFPSSIQILSSLISMLNGFNGDLPQMPNKREATWKHGAHCKALITVKLRISFSMASGMGWPCLKDWNLWGLVPCSIGRRLHGLRTGQEPQAPKTHQAHGTYEIYANFICITHLIRREFPSKSKSRNCTKLREANFIHNFGDKGDQRCTFGRQRSTRNGRKTTRKHLGQKAASVQPGFHGRAPCLQAIFGKKGSLAISIVQELNHHHHHHHHHHLVWNAAPKQGVAAKPQAP